MHGGVQCAAFIPHTLHWAQAATCTPATNFKPDMQQPRVLKATRDVVAVYKPAGMPFHSQGVDRPGLLAALRARGPALLDGTAAAGARLYALHRLDTDTSGVVAFATSRETAGLLAREFRQKR